MIYRAIVLYVAVQSVVVASPVISDHGETIVSPFYRPTPASKARVIPEIGKLPRTSAVVSKKHPARGSTKVTPGINHSTRSGRNPVIEHQLPKLRTNHFHFDESRQRPKALISSDERAEKVNSDLEKMIQFMTILGQVDRYLSSRAKSFVSTLGRAMENSPDDNQLYSDKASYDY